MVESMRCCEYCGQKGETPTPCWACSTDRSVKNSETNAGGYSCLPNGREGTKILPDAGQNATTEYKFREIEGDEVLEEIVQTGEDCYEIRIPAFYYQINGTVNWEGPSTPLGCCPPYINAHCKCNWWKDEYCDFCVEDYLDDGQDTSYTEQ